MRGFMALFAALSALALVSRVLLFIGHHPLLWLPSVGALICGIILLDTWGKESHRKATEAEAVKTAHFAEMDRIIEGMESRLREDRRRHRANP